MKPPANIGSLFAHCSTRLKHSLTIHRQGSEPNLFIFSTPRSGTTWLAEMLATQGRFKVVNEPFNLRKPVVVDNLGISHWESLFEESSRPKIARYIQSFIDGNDRDPRFKRENPFSDFWHFRTDRVLFKILFAGEDSIDWFCRQFNGRAILLVRHPVPVALSRTELPRLRSFLAPPFSAYLSAMEKAHAAQVIASGNQLQMAVLDWALKNALPLRSIRPEWLLVTYEQLVMQPDLVVDALASRLDLPSPERMRERLFKASGSTGKSVRDSQAVLLNDTLIRDRRRWLVEKWQDQAAAAEIDAAFDTLEVFGIDVYQRGQTMPAAKYLIET